MIDLSIVTIELFSEPIELIAVPIEIFLRTH